MVTAAHRIVTALLGALVPPLFDSPHRSTTLVEYWTKRWNLPASQALHRYIFKPIARYGAEPALFGTFIVSAVGHALLAEVARQNRTAGLMTGAFFLVQPLFIAVERRIGVRKWTSLAGWAWTITVLGISSPLLVEPLVQIVERSWGAGQDVLLPTAAVLGFVIVLTAVTSAAPLVVKRRVEPAALRSAAHYQDAAERAG
jgi:hypothetical protein